MRYRNNSNFKLAPYYAWVDAGGKVVKPFYGLRKLRSLLNIQERLINKNSTTAILCFSEPPSLDVDTFPWWGHYEIIPVVWDCWPKYWDYTEQWFQRHGVRSAVFTSSQTADEFRRRLPEMNILTITEGIETKLYKGEKVLTERNVDILLFGRIAKKYGNLDFGNLRKVVSKDEQSVLQTRSDLINALADAKVVLNVPRCDMQPELAGGIETLTQRYWECMLSGVVMLGRSPKELTDLIGYDPTVPLIGKHIEGQIRDIIVHIEKYQPLVDKNKETALALGDWTFRVETIKKWLRGGGYNI